MKRSIFVLIILALAFLLCGTAFAADYSFSKQTIKVEQEKEYLKVTVTYDAKKEPIVYRVYPCGKVDRQDWKELSPNKEQNTYYWSTAPTLDTIVPDTIIWDNRLNITH